MEVDDSLGVLGLFSDRATFLSGWLFASAGEVVMVEKEEEEDDDDVDDNDDDDDEEAEKDDE